MYILSAEDEGSDPFPRQDFLFACKGKCDRIKKKEYWFDENDGELR